MPLESWNPNAVMSRGGHRYVRLPCGFARVEPVGNRPIRCGPRALSAVCRSNPDSIHREKMDLWRKKRLTGWNKSRTKLSSPEQPAGKTRFPQDFPRAVNTLVDTGLGDFEMFALFLIALFTAIGLASIATLADNGLRWWSAFGQLRRELRGGTTTLPMLRPAYRSYGPAPAVRSGGLRASTTVVSRAA